MGPGAGPEFDPQDIIVAVHGSRFTVQRLGDLRFPHSEKRSRGIDEDNRLKIQIQDAGRLSLM